MNRAPCGSEAQRVFQRALDLLSSNAPESDEELLEMVRKAKKEQDSTFFHPPKRLRTARAGGEGDAKPNSRSAAEQTVSQPSSTTQSGKTVPVTGLVRLGPSSGVARGRVEKPKRKASGR